MRWGYFGAILWKYSESQNGFQRFYRTMNMPNIIRGHFWWIWVRNGGLGWHWTLRANSAPLSFDRPKSLVWLGLKKVQNHLEFCLPSFTIFVIHPGQPWDGLGMQICSSEGYKKVTKCSICFLPALELICDLNRQNYFHFIVLSLFSSFRPLKRGTYCFHGQLAQKRKLSIFEVEF